ncbi:MAG: CooT family nickel-binding protein [Dehalococcoidia bacterium]|jgi:predicted RNA-binding protein|nr:CooT family nickel-binding protein [Chloroflexota bacterium]MCK4242341.1 CooT family nickel-binding protein [Dehalococcoidia bacterium]
MCIATVYIDTVSGKEEVMGDVVLVECENDGLRLTALLGEQKLLQAKVKSIDFLEHSVVVERGEAR